jgi:hypothetical protein
MNVDGRSFRIIDVLLGSIESFRLKQRELEWTAIAYSIYLPPRSTWTNRFEEETSFDDLAKELMSRSLKTASCGAIHRFSALTTIAEADRTAHFLSASCRKRARTFVRDAIDVAIEKQQQDGAWNIGWFASLETQTPGDDIESYLSDSDAARLLVTGHMIEWFRSLPIDTAIPTNTIARAETWLANALKRVSEEECWRDYCPWAHAKKAIILGND